MNVIAIILATLAIISQAFAALPLKVDDSKSDGVSLLKDLLDEASDTRPEVQVALSSRAGWGGHRHHRHHRHHHHTPPPTGQPSAQVQCHGQYFQCFQERVEHGHRLQAVGAACSDLVRELKRRTSANLGCSNWYGTLTLASGDAQLRQLKADIPLNWVRPKGGSTIALERSFAACGSWGVGSCHPIDHLLPYVLPDSCGKGSYSCSPTMSPTRTPTRHPTRFPTRHPTRFPTNSPTRHPTRFPTEHPTTLPPTTDKPSFAPTHTPTEVPTREPTHPPTDPPTPQPSYYPTRLPTPGPTNDPTLEPTRFPTEHPTHEPTRLPTQEPTHEPTHSPTEDPTTLPPTTDEPSHSPTHTPTEEPTPEPTHSPTLHPTEEPTEEPTPQPTPEPTQEPTYYPTQSPTRTPTSNPTHEPTAFPSPSPTEEPTTLPPTTDEPSNSPTHTPTEHPTPLPTVSPTDEPTDHPTLFPTDEPTDQPTLEPTLEPTFMPTEEPTHHPTGAPTDRPTHEPTHLPTQEPTHEPTHSPTEDPTTLPPTTDEPSHSPTHTPTEEPTPEPTHSPTLHPTELPTEEPTLTPSSPPSPAPTEYPTPHPTEHPSLHPTHTPTLHPTTTPTPPPTKVDCTRVTWDATAPSYAGGARRRRSRQRKVCKAYSHCAWSTHRGCTSRPTPAPTQTPTHAPVTIDMSKWHCGHRKGETSGNCALGDCSWQCKIGPSGKGWCVTFKWDAKSQKCTLLASAPKPLSSPKGFKCNKKKRFVPGAGYSQWSSFTNKGGEDGRAKCRAHFKNGAAAPNGWWYQFYSNGHFNCAKFNSKVTVPESKWENTHGRPEEVCVPAASPCAGKHNIKNRAYRESPDAYCKRFIPIAGCNAWHIKKYCPLACCLKGE